MPSAVQIALSWLWRHRVGPNLRQVNPPSLPSRPTIPLTHPHPSTHPPPPAHSPTPALTHTHPPAPNTTRAARTFYSPASGWFLLRAQRFTNLYAQRWLVVGDSQDRKGCRLRSDYIGISFLGISYIGISFIGISYIGISFLWISYIGISFQCGWQTCFNIKD